MATKKRRNVLENHNLLVFPEAYSQNGFSLSREDRTFLTHCARANIISQYFHDYFGESSEFYFHANKKGFKPDGFNLNLFAGGFTDSSISPEHFPHKFSSEELNGSRHIGRSSDMGGQSATAQPPTLTRKKPFTVMLPMPAILLPCTAHGLMSMGSSITKPPSNPLWISPAR